MRETKQVSYKELKVGQIVESYSQDGYSHMATIKILEITPLFVRVDVYGHEKTLVNEGLLFTVNLTEDEIKLKYKSAAKEIITNIQNKISQNEIGYHEMWNSWCSFDPYEMAHYCGQEGIKIIGYCTDIIPRHHFAGFILDIGVCAEYIDNGERFWCHQESKSLQLMLEDYSDLLEQVDLKS